jgi:rhamnose transport system substrate-binding protein
LLLLIAIGMDLKPGVRKAATVVVKSPGNEEFEMRNSQVAMLSIVILLAAAIIAGSNFWLVRSISNSTSPPTSAGKRITVAMMPKSKGNAYFIACRKGADEAAKELGVDLIWDGPTSPDPAKQNEVVEAWITRGVDVIAVACENGDGIADVLAKARSRGIKVITWDADTKVDSRDFFVNQATPEDIGQTLMDNAAKVMHGKGEFAIISASTTASNMIAWRKSIESRRADKYPDMTMDAHEACDDKQEIAFDQTRAIMNRYPNVKVIMAICSPAAPGAAEAVTQSGRNDVKVVGVSLPNANKLYVKSGVTDDIVLWKTQDLGYLAVLAAYDLQTGKLRPGDTSMDGERLGKIEIQKDRNIILGKPFTFTKDNIDQFDF